MATDDGDKPNFKILEVKVLGATGLRDADANGKSDPFCTIEMEDGSGVLAQSSVHQNTLNPKWNEVLRTDKYIVGQSILFKVWDKDIKKEDELLGKVAVSSVVFVPNGSSVLKLQLDVGKGKKIKKDLKSELRVKFVGVRDIPGSAATSDQKIPKDTAEPAKEDDQKSGQGAPDQSISQEPAPEKSGQDNSDQKIPEEAPEQKSSRNTAGLTDETKLLVQDLDITVLGAKGLRNADSSGKSDPYCTVELEGRNGVLSRTTVQNNSLSPVWNEILHVREYNVGKSIIFKVWDKDFKQGDCRPSI